MEILLDSVPQINQNYCTREIDGELIFFEETGRELHSIEETGLFIYKNIDGLKTIKSIIKLLCEEYDINEKTASNDILDFINELAKKNIIFIKK